MRQHKITYALASRAFSSSKFEKKEYAMVVTMMIGAMYAERPDWVYGEMKPFLSELFSEYVKSGNPVSGSGISDEEWIRRIPTIVSQYTFFDYCMSQVEPGKDTSRFSSVIQSVINRFIAENPEGESAKYAPSVLVACSCLSKKTDFSAMQLDTEKLPLALLRSVFGLGRADDAHDALSADDLAVLARLEEGNKISDQDGPVMQIAACFSAWRSMLMRFFHDAGVKPEPGHVKAALMADSIYVMAEPRYEKSASISCAVTAERYMSLADASWNVKNCSGLAELGSSKSTIEIAKELVESHGEDLKALLKNEEAMKKGNLESLPDFVKDLAIMTENKFDSYAKDSGFMGVSDALLAASNELFSRCSYVAVG